MTDISKSIRISDSTRRVMEALADTIIPSEGPDRPGASDMNLVDRLLDWLGQIKGAVHFLTVISWMWEFSPIWSGKFARLSKLTPADRLNVLESWESSRFFIKRYPLFFTKMMYMAAFYNNSDLWPHIGYEEGCLSDPPNKL